jgi:hypothetical protein
MSTLGIKTQSKRFLERQKMATEMRPKRAKQKKITLEPMPANFDVPQIRKSLVQLINKTDAQTLYYAYGLLFQIDKAQQVRNLYKSLLTEKRAEH